MIILIIMAMVLIIILTMIDESWLLLGKNQNDTTGDGLTTTGIVVLLSFLFCFQIWSKQMATW
jgi:hypothetical protein